MMNRRGFLAGLVGAIAAPAVIRTPGLLMPIKPLLDEYPFRRSVHTFEIAADFAAPNGDTALWTQMTEYKRLIIAEYYQRVLLYSEFPDGKQSAVLIKNLAET